MTNNLHFSSEGSIACSSHRNDDKSDDRTPNPYTRRTPSSPPPTQPPINSRSSLKRTRDYDEHTAHANTAVPRVRIDEPLRSSDESVLNRSSMLRIVDYNHPSDEESYIGHSLAAVPMPTTTVTYTPLVDGCSVGTVTINFNRDTEC